MTPQALLDLLGAGLMVAGFVLLVSARRALHSARQRGVLAVKGPYGFVRHPQYVALIVVLFGLLVWWPTAATLLALVGLAWRCVRRGRKEETRMGQEFGCAWDCYAYGRPAFVPRLSRVRSAIAELIRSVTQEKGGEARVSGASAPASHRRVS